MEAFERMMKIYRGEIIVLKPGIMVILAIGSLLMNLVMIFILDVDDIEKSAEELKKEQVEKEKEEMTEVHLVSESSDN